MKDSIFLNAIGALVVCLVFGPILLLYASAGIFVFCGPIITVILMLFGLISTDTLTVLIIVWFVLVIGLFIIKK